MEGLDANSLGRSLGYSNHESERGDQFLTVEQRFPRIFIELTYRAIAQNKISVRRAAGMLGISDIELEERLEDTAIFAVRF